MRKPRCDSYEAQLTPKEQCLLVSQLLNPMIDCHWLRLTLPPWRAGPRKGRPVSYRTLVGLAARLQAAERMLIADLFSLSIGCRKFPMPPFNSN
jgi:hypothetical protein